MDQVLGNGSLADLAKRKSYKWRTYPRDVLPVFVAEMDFAIAEPVADAVRAALAIGDTGYPHVGELGDAYREFAADHLGWAVNPDWVFAVPDVMSGIAEILLALTPPGGGVVINPPVYGPFAMRIELVGRTVVNAPLRAIHDGSYELDLELIDQALARDDVHAYLLCSPHNPLGQIWSAEQLSAVADICGRRGKLLLVDEIHSPLALPGNTFTPFASLDHEMASAAFIFTSASKGWNIPGLKCGIAVTGTQYGADVLTARWEALLASHLGVLATIAAFRSGLDWLDAALGQIQENTAVLSQSLAGQLPAVRYRPGQASFLAWLDCRDLGLGDDPAQVFLRRGKVALSPGPSFGAEGAGFARLNIGTSPQIIAEAVERMATAVEACR